MSFISQKKKKKKKCRPTLSALKELLVGNRIGLPSITKEG